MTDTLTLTGLVATPPKHTQTATGLSITSFRLASNQRRYDRVKGEWVDAETNWYTVTTFRQLAKNVVLSVQKGQRIVVTGRVRVRDWSSEEKTGTTIELDADALGHDLSWGTTQFTRSAIAAVTAAEGEEGEPSEGGSGEAHDEFPSVVVGDDDRAAGVTREREADSLATPF